MISPSPTSSSVYKDDVLALSPVAYFPLDENTGATNMTDMGTSPQTNTITSPTQINFGATGAINESGSKGYNFTTNNSYSLSGTTNNGVTTGKNISLEAWVNANSINSSYGNQVINRDAVVTSARIWQFRFWANGKFEFIPFFAGTPQGIHSEQALNDGKWHHVVGTVAYNATTNKSIIRLYIDGNMSESPEYTGSLPINGGKIGIGYASTMTGGAHYKGLLDEVAVYNTTLSKADVLRHYAKGKGKLYFQYAKSDAQVGQTTTSSEPIVQPSMLNKTSGTTYSLTPGYPFVDGLSIDSSTGAIYGTPSTTLSDGLNIQTIEVHVRSSNVYGISDAVATINLYPSKSSQLNQKAIFRPILRFDTNERWRPIDVDSLLSEGTHKLCIVDTTPSCVFITSAAELNQKINNLPYGSNYYIDIAGTSPLGVDAIGTLPCNGFITDPYMKDCDTGDTSRMYVHQTYNPEDGHNYLDYWMFYRYNRFSDDSTLPEQDASDGNHEGDWEAITVAALPNSHSFDFVIFSAHEYNWRYLRENLQCGENSPTSTSSCEEAPTNGSVRVNSYVAKGTHANYAFACEETAPYTCGQLNGGVAWERSHDGAVAWGNNDNAPLNEFPDATTSDAWTNPLNITNNKSWTYWPGRWGSTTSTFGGAVGFANSPDGPGVKGNNRFSQPWENYDCLDINNVPDNCYTTNSASRAAFATKATSESKSLDENKNECEEWNGPGVVVAACNQRKTNNTPNVDVISDNKVTIGKRKDILQITGVNNLQPGDKIKIHSPSEEMKVFVSADGGKADTGNITQSTFTGNKNLKTITIQATTDGFPLIRGIDSSKNTIYPFSSKRVHTKNN